MRIYIRPQLLQVDRQDALSLAALRSLLDSDSVFSTLSDWSSVEIGRHGRLLTPDDLVQPEDELAVIEPLLADPKQARRLRVEAERARQAAEEGRPSRWQR